MYIAVSQVYKSGSKHSKRSKINCIITILYLISHQISQCNTTMCCEASNLLKLYCNDKVKENSASESSEAKRPA